MDLVGDKLPDALLDDETDRVPLLEEDVVDDSEGELVI